jgi:hypothetical protein
MLTGLPNGARLSCGAVQCRSYNRRLPQRPGAASFRRVLGAAAAEPIRHHNSGRHGASHQRTFRRRCIRMCK